MQRCIIENCDPVNEDFNLKINHLKVPIIITDENLSIEANGKQLIEEDDYISNFENIDETNEPSDNSILAIRPDTGFVAETRHCKKILGNEKKNINILSDLVLIVQNL